MKKASHRKQDQGSSVQPLSFFQNNLKVFLVLLGLCLVVFGNSIKNDYSLDDEFVTYNNAQVMKGVKAIPEIFSSRYVVDGEKAKYGYRPIVKMSFAIENEFFGQNPHIGHFINIILYSLVCFVLFIFLRKILREHTAAFSFWIVLLFLLHPFHNEVVVSLKNRDALLSLLFGLMAMNYAIEATAAAKPLKYLWAMIFLTLAMLSKTDVLPFLFLIPFTIFFFEKAGIRKVAMISGVIVLIFIAGKMAVGSILSDVGNKRDFVYVENPLFFTDGLMPRVIAAFSSFSFYVTHMIFPYKLLSYYGYNVVEVLKLNFHAYMGILFALAAFVFLFMKFRKNDVVYYGVLFFCISSSMFLNLVKPAVGVVAERFMFVPSVGFCIAAVALLYRFFNLSSLKETALFPNSRYTTVMVVIALLFTVQGISRNPDWKDHLTLYTTDSEKEPDSAKLHALTAAKLIQDIGKYPDKREKRAIVNQAVEHYQRALAIYPDYITSLNNLGMIYQSYLGKHKEAEVLFRKALSLDTAYVEAWANLGSAQMSLNDTSSAIHSLLSAIRLKPDFTLAYTNATTALVKKGRYDEAMMLNLTGLKVNVDGSYYLNLGKIYIHKGDTLTGISYLAKASEMDQNNQMLCKYLFDYYKRKGDLESAKIYQLRFQSAKVNQ